MADDSDPAFDGDTYDEDLDGARLSSQLERVQAVMSDGRWRTLNQIRVELGATQDSTPAISARLRDLRKAHNGRWFVDSRRNALTPGLWEYRVVEPDEEQARRRRPPKPTPPEIKQALGDLRQMLKVAKAHGFQPEFPLALRRLGVWLRFLAGEDVTAALGGKK